MYVKCIIVIIVVFYEHGTVAFYKHLTVAFYEHLTGVLYIYWINTSIGVISDIYIVKLFVAKDYRNASAYQVIHLSKGDPPKIYQR